MSTYDILIGVKQLLRLFFENLTDSPDTGAVDLDSYVARQCPKAFKYFYLISFSVAYSLDFDKERR